MKQQQLYNLIKEIQQSEYTMYRKDAENCVIKRAAFNVWIINGRVETYMGNFYPKYTFPFNVSEAWVRKKIKDLYATEYERLRKDEYTLPINYVPDEKTKIYDLTI